MKKVKIQLRKNAKKCEKNAGGNDTALIFVWLGKGMRSILWCCCILTLLLCPAVRNIRELEALRQCIPPPKQVVPVSRSGYPDPYLDPHPDPWSPPKFNRLFNGPLPTFSENFVQIRSEAFYAKLLTDRQANNDDYISSLAEVKTHFSYVPGVGTRDGIFVQFLLPDNEIVIILETKSYHVSCYFSWTAIMVCILSLSPTIQFLFRLSSLARF